MTTITELKKLLFSMILKTPIWLVHLAANQSSVMSIPSVTTNYSKPRWQESWPFSDNNTKIL